jgi:hypothetical protein
MPCRLLCVSALSRSYGQEAQVAFIAWMMLLRLLSASSLHRPMLLACAGGQSLYSLGLGKHLLMPPARQTSPLVTGADTTTIRPTGAQAQTAAARHAASTATLRPSAGRRTRSSSPTRRARARAPAAKSVGCLSGWMRWQLKLRS